MMMNEKLEAVHMSSDNSFQESQFSASSTTRRKVDVLSGREHGDSKEQVLPDSKCNLRMSLAWDSAFFTSPGVLEPEELFTTLNSRNFDYVVNILGNEEHLLLSSQSLEPDTHGKVENFNFRKSLAWDNGFFTSEGVLDPFELAIVNNGYKKCESNLLPVIEDEVWRSMESNSTLDKEGFSLTRLEMDLFEEIRGSMPRPTSSSFELGRPAPAVQDSSRTMMKAMPTCIRQSTNKHRSKKITSEMPNAPKIQLKHRAESREHYSSSSLKPSNCVSRGSTKRASLGEKHVKLGSRSGISASAEGLGKSKKPGLSHYSIYAMHGPNQSLRSSLSHCSTSTNKSISSSNVCRHPPSEIIIEKSPPNLRRKVHSQGAKILATGPASTTPPLVKTRANKIELESPLQAAYVQSTPTSSCYGSPSSSLDEWSLESSSTSAAQRSIKSKASPYSSLRSYRLENHACEESNVGHETSVNHHHRKYHNGDGNTNAKTSTKPSGLRMPSPKLGFFDAENMLDFAATKGESTEGTPIANTNATGSRRLKNGGIPASLPATKGNRSPTTKSRNRILQSSNNQPLKTQEIIAQHRICQDGNKENEVSLADQIDGLEKYVKSIHLNSDLVTHLSDL